MLHLTLQQSARKVQSRLVGHAIQIGQAELLLMAGQQITSSPLEHSLLQARVLFNALYMAVHVRDNFGNAGPPKGLSIAGLVPPLEGLALLVPAPQAKGKARAPAPKGPVRAKLQLPANAGALAKAPAKANCKGLGKGKGKGNGYQVAKAAAPTEEPVAAPVPPAVPGVAPPAPPAALLQQVPLPPFQPARGPSASASAAPRAGHLADARSRSPARWHTV